MWSFSQWRRQRRLAKSPVAAELWQRVRQGLPILDGLSAEQDALLLENSVLFLQDKHITCLPGVELSDEQRLHLAAQAQLPLLNLGDLNWYQGFHE
uniref:zinc-dependent peptidase n=2 Tax=Pseudomonas syringae group TaxID=136849 RepID=UPI00197CD5A9